MQNTSYIINQYKTSPHVTNKSISCGENMCKNGLICLQIKARHKSQVNLIITAWANLSILVSLHLTLRIIEHQCYSNSSTHMRQMFKKEQYQRILVYIRKKIIQIL